MECDVQIASNDVMLAAWYERNGPASDVLQVGNRPVTPPKHGEVLVRVICSGVNPSDVKSRAGGRAASQGYIIPHSDGAGVIEQVGAGGDRRRVGERVWVWNAQYGRQHGTAAQFVTLPQEQAVRLPDNTSFEAGACLGIPALTAFRAVELADLHKDDTALIIGGSSSVGFYAAQIARARGAKVIATVGSDTKADFLHKAGFTQTILYKEESVSERVRALTGGEGVQAVIDMDFSTSAGLVDEGVLAPHGRFVCYGSNVRGPVPITYGAWLPRSLSLLFFLVYELTPGQRARAVSGLQNMLEQGTLQHHIGPRFPLADIVAAHQAVESGQSLGNVIVDCNVCGGLRSSL